MIATQNSWTQRITLNSSEYSFTLLVMKMD